MSAWEHTASLTGSRRHAITATTCRDIAIERLLTAMAAEIATEQKREVLRISREICDEADRHESRINITEIRAILARMTAEIDQPNQPF